LLAYREILDQTALLACGDQLALVAVPALAVPVRLVRQALPALEASKGLMGLLVAWVPLVLVPPVSKAKLVLAFKASLA
jgi:hypothetical protein